MATVQGLQILSNAEIDDRDLKPDAADRLVKGAGSEKLLGFVKNAFTTAQQERNTSNVEARLMDALRRRKGQYSSEDQKAYEEQGTAIVYVPLTERKCNGAEAWMGDVLLPYGDRIWALEPTPLPDLPDSVLNSIVEKVMEEVITTVRSSGIPPTPDQVEQLSRSMREEVEARRWKAAKKRAGNMEKAIGDQLLESDWIRVFKDFISHTVTFGTGFLKGPVVRSVKTLRWEGDQPVVDQEQKPLAEAPSPLDIYPSPEATEVLDGYIIERSRMSRTSVGELRDLQGYQPEQIDALMQDSRGGSSVAEMQADDERARLEEKPDRSHQYDSLIEVFEYWGPVEGELLKEWGVSGAKSGRDYEFQIIWSGDHVLKVMPNPDPLGRRPYHKAVYKRVVGSFWGNGIPHLMESSQDRANATMRSLVTNMGVASGPQAEIDVSRLPDGEDISNIHPLKIWQTTNEQGSATPAVRFFQPSSNATELQATYLQAISDAELESGVPTHAALSEQVPGAGRTASGLSMLLNAASRGIKEAFANIDQRAVGPLVERFYVWNMMFNEDPEIKGDLNVVTRGATGMLLREIQLQKVSEFMDRTNNPIDQQIIGIEGRADLLRVMADLMHLENRDIIPTEQELKTRVEQAQQEQAQATALQQQQASAAGGGPNTLGTTPTQE